MKPRKKRRRPFVDLRPTEIDVGAPGDAALFLGRFDPEGLRRQLEQAGILAALAERGYPDVAVRTARVSGEHRVTLVPRGARVGLVDLRMAEAATVVAEPALRALGLDVLSFLSVHWLALQDPKGRFTAARPRLPGQRYPGLRLGKHLYARVIAWAEAWGKDGLLNFPAYFHNARFYSALFQFISPERQGRFEALMRDLALVHVAEASSAIEAGRVVQDPGRRVFRWEPGEMVAPLTPKLRGALESVDYREAVKAARERVRYLFSPPQSSQGHRPRRSRKL